MFICRRLNLWCNSFLVVQWCKYWCITDLHCVKESLTGVDWMYRIATIPWYHIYTLIRPLVLYDIHCKFENISTLRHLIISSRFVCFVAWPACRVSFLKLQMRTSVSRASDIFRPVDPCAILNSPTSDENYQPVQNVSFERWSSLIVLSRRRASKSLKRLMPAMVTPKVDPRSPNTHIHHIRIYM